MIHPALGVPIGAPATHQASAGVVATQRSDAIVRLRRVGQGGGNREVWTTEQGMNSSKQGV